MFEEAQHLFKCLILDQKVLRLLDNVSLEMFALSCREFRMCILVSAAVFLTRVHLLQCSFRSSEHFL